VRAAIRLAVGAVAGRTAVRGLAAGALPPGAADQRRKWIGRAIFAVRAARGVLPWRQAAAVLLLALPSAG